jgi:hypothetical protein
MYFRLSLKLKLSLVQEIPGIEHAEEDEEIPADQLPGNPLNHPYN